MTPKQFVYHKAGYLGLILAGLGASIPFGVSDSTQDAKLTPFEEASTIAFIASTFILILTVFFKDFTKWREETLLLTGGLWFSVGTVQAIDLNHNSLALTQLALTLTAYGLGVLSFDLWYRTRHDDPH